MLQLTEQTFSLQQDTYLLVQLDNNKTITCVVLFVKTFMSIIIKRFLKQKSTVHINIVFGVGKVSIQKFATRIPYHVSQFVINLAILCQNNWA